MMRADPTIYGAVTVSILAAVLGVLVCLLVLRRVILDREVPRPAVTLLLFSLFGMSFSQGIEQGRVLVFRLSYDGYLNVEHFASLYASTWNVAASKVLFAVSITVAAAVKLGLYCGRPDSTVFRWAAAAAAGTAAMWWALTEIFHSLL
jgi:hypothetical protein